MTRGQTITKTTTNRAEIRRWVESKGGWPAHVKGSGRGNDPGLLRIDFPGYSGVETLAKMSWDDWFKWFDKKRLAFLHQPSSRFPKLVSRDTTAIGSSTRATPRRATGAKRATAKRATAKRVAKKATTRTTPKRRTATATAGRGTVKRTATPKRGAAKRTTKRTTAKRATRRASPKRSAR